MVRNSMVCNWVKVFDYLNQIFDDFERKQPTKAS